MTSTPDPRSTTFVVYLACGMLLGVVLGLVLDNIGLWTGLGLLAGAVLGLLSGRGQGSSKTSSRRRP